MSDTPKDEKRAEAPSAESVPEKDIPVLIPAEPDTRTVVDAGNELSLEPTVADDTVEENQSTSPPVDEPPQPTQAPPKKQRLATVLAVIAILLSLATITALVVGAYYYVWPQWAAVQTLPDQQQDDQNELETLRLELASQQQALAAQRQLLDQSEQQRQELALALADSGVQMNDLQAQINTVRHTDRSDWLLAEVEYLTRLAHQRVMSDRNITVAISLLQQADEILRDMGRADVFSLRAQLGQDIQALRMADTVDVAGTLIKLQTLSAAVPHLSFVSQRQFRLETPLTTVDSDDEVSWQTKLKQAVDDMYRFQAITEPPEPVLSLDQVGLLKQQVKLRLVQAEYALMRGDQTLFDQSLRFCSESIADYAEKSANKVVFMEQLAALRAVVIAGELPDITGSHTAVYDYSEARRGVPKIEGSK